MSDSHSGNAVVSEPLLRWLDSAVERGASDIHLIPGYPPALRVHGELTELPEPALNGTTTETVIRSLCPDRTYALLIARKDIDLSLSLETSSGVGRYRANLFHVGGLLGACLRVVPTAIPSFEWAAFPVNLAWKLARLRDGLIFVTGATGTGKTTTLAMIVNLLNQEGGYRIITVEEPVEYVYPRAANSVVTQREVGIDVPTFADGLKYGLRQDPDVILVGEIRDRETAQIAMSAAETGHLVFSTLHTRDTKGAITRFADFFPQDVQRDVRAQLSISLRAVIGQRLLPGVEKGSRRHLALEVLWNTHPIASAIRFNKIESIDNYLITSREDGMLSFDESIRQLLRSGKISRQVAEANAREPAVLNR